MSIDTCWDGIAGFAGADTFDLSDPDSGCMMKIELGTMLRFRRLMEWTPGVNKAISMRKGMKCAVRKDIKWRLK